MKAKVLLVQNGPATVDTEKNVEENLALVAEATKDYSPDFVVFSELSNTQYFCGYNTPEHFKLAEPIDGPSVRRFQELAKRLGSYVLFPFYEKGEVKGEFYNSVAVIGRDGELIPGDLPDGRQVKVYRKNHIPDQWSYSPGLNERYYFKEGPGLATFRTEFGKISILICYERSFPEAWRVLALQGSKIMFVPVAAWGPNRADSWGGELRTAAIQNGLFVVASNKGGVENTEGPRHFFGASRIISPLGEELTAAPAGEGPHILKAELDLDEIDQHGVRYTFFRDRRPELYGSLSDDIARGVL
ncbi:carbon-nitrogen hydrolase family protein [Streptosporangium amethystogenes subsp. fukuiense]|uniref:Carbon-nitrogen hydrolase family protein n=1 Tax=Streptosporangium amethystogenes subsp. fukuiense TaxID=698418 RepID=A0ABW2T1I8_9ACTN